MTPARLCCLLVVAALLGGPVHAQEVAEPGSELDVYLMTMGQGDNVWERFGHNALGIRDRVRGTDVIYNWGTFSFNDPGFAPRFLKGNMRYWVQAEDAARALDLYRYLNRSIWIQELRLTPKQKLEARAFVEWNAREENKFYRYDYFGDNCSTRVRDALDRIVGGALKARFGARPSGRTFRDETRRLTAGGFWTFVGIDLALGTPADREMTRWESMYVPGALRDAVRELRLDGANGPQSIVASEQQVFVAERAPEPLRPPLPIGQFLGVGVLIAAAIAVLVSRGGSRGRSIAWALAFVWCLVSGLVGVILTLMWTVTDHVWTHMNANLLLLSPLWLLGVWSVSRRGWRESAAGRRVAMGLAALGVLALVLTVVRTPQRSELIVALAFPVHAAVLWMFLRRETRAT